MKKTMNENALIAINNDINYLMHTGRKGQKKGVFGASGATRWQSQAVYAKYTPNPNEDKSNNKKSSMYGPYDLSDAKSGISKLKTGVGNALAKSRAKNDAAVSVALQNPNRGTKGSRRIALQAIGAGVAGGAIGGAIGDVSASMLGNALTKRGIQPRNPAGKRLISPIKTIRGDQGTIKDVANSFNKYMSLADKHSDIDKFRNQLASDNAFRVKNDINDARAFGRVYGALNGMSYALTAYRDSLRSAYAKRVNNKNFGKMSKSQISLYKKTYNDYLKKYAEPTRLNYSNFIDLSSNNDRRFR